MLVLIRILDYRPLWSSKLLFLLMQRLHSQTDGSYLLCRQAGEAAISIHCASGTSFLASASSSPNHSSSKSHNGDGVEEEGDDDDDDDDELKLSIMDECEVPVEQASAPPPITTTTTTSATTTTSSSSNTPTVQTTSTSASFDALARQFHAGAPDDSEPSDVAMPKWPSHRFPHRIPYTFPPPPMLAAAEQQQQEAASFQRFKRLRYCHAFAHRGQCKFDATTVRRMLRAQVLEREH